MVQIIQRPDKFKGLAAALQGIIAGQDRLAQRKKQQAEIASVNNFFNPTQGPVQTPTPTTPFAQQMFAQGLQNRQAQQGQRQAQEAQLAQALAIEKARQSKPRSGVSLATGSTLVDPVTGKEIAKGAAKEANIESQTELVARLGELIATGKATEKQMGVFRALTDKAGTTVNVNTGEGIVGGIKEQIAAAKEGQQVLNEFTNDPANEQILKNSDVNMVTNSKGQLQLEVKPKATPASTQVKEISDLIGLQNSLSTIDSLYDEEFVGPIRGNKALASISEATGIGTSTREVQFRRITADLADRLLRARSGAQINEQEFKRLSKILPEPNLSPLAFKARMESFRTDLENIISTKRQVLKEAGFRAIGEEQETIAAQPVEEANQITLETVTAEQLQSMTAEQLDELERQAGGI